jgi:hypothetical protein
MTQRNRKLIAVLAVLAIAWGALFYSGRGFLVWQWTDADAHRISCWYLAADGIAKRSGLSVGDLIGSECKRVVDLH